VFNTHHHQEFASLCNTEINEIHCEEGSHHLSVHRNGYSELGTTEPSNLVCVIMY